MYYRSKSQNCLNFDLCRADLSWLHKAWMRTQNGAVLAGGALPQGTLQLRWLSIVAQLLAYIFQIMSKCFALGIEFDHAYKVCRSITYELAYFPKSRFTHFTVENSNIILQNILILNCMTSIMVAFAVDIISQNR